MTGIAIDLPLARCIEEFDAQIYRNARRQPIRRRVILPVVGLAVEAAVAARRGLESGTFERRYEGLGAAGDEESVGEGIAAVAGRAGGPTDDTDGGFEENRIGDVTVRIALARGVLRVARFIASRRDRVSCRRFHGRKDSGQGSAPTDAGRRFEARKAGTCGR